jgi:hypothetical protein
MEGFTEPKGSPTKNCSGRPKTGFANRFGETTQPDPAKQANKPNRIQPTESEMRTGEAYF